jgi:ketosteroid isomerase-like protein
MAGENLELVRRGMEAFDRGDWEEFFNLLDPDIEWGYQPAHPEVPGFRGHDGVREFLSLWADAWDEYRFEPTEFVEVGDSVVVDGRECGRPKGGGPEIDQQVHAVWTLRDGKAVRYRLFMERAQAMLSAAES